MDTLKKQLNDIGSCIGYPFYFFEDGSFSHTFVCGKMNACLVVKAPFTESDMCFFASAEVASMSGIKATEKSWAKMSDAPEMVNRFKKYLNDIGSVLNYPFYVFDDGAYAKSSSLDDKLAVLVVKKSFTSVEGESSFFSSDAQKVLQFNEDLKKLQQQRETQKTELQQIVFRMLANRAVSDDEILKVIEAGRLDVIPDYIKNASCDLYDVYPKSLQALVKADYDEMWSKFHWLVLSFCPRTFIEYVFREGGFKTLKFFLENVCSPIFDKVYPQHLIERGDVELYQYYRSYAKSKWECGYYYDSEFSAILKFKAADMLAVLLQFSDLKPEEQAKLVESGDRDLIRTYVQMRGLSEHFRQLLLYSGYDELVELANQPKEVPEETLQDENVSSEPSGLFQKIRKFFGARA